MAKAILRNMTTCRRAARAVALSCAVAAAPAAPTVQAAPLLRCEVDHGGRTWRVDTAPVADPYGVQPLDIGGRFRFKAVMVGDERQVEYVKLYAYYQTRRTPVLLHEAKYLAPKASADPAGTPLTGEHTVFSPHLEREMRYHCTLHEAAP